MNQESMDHVQLLIVDDEESIREGAKRILTRMEFDVFMASNGADGLKIVGEKDIAIVLLDLKMPGMDGMEVLQRIKEKYIRVLVIVITGFATLETAIEAMKGGAYDFIPKPFEPDQLRIVVNRARETIRLRTEAEKLEIEKRRTLVDLGMEKSRIRTIIESLPNGVVVTNRNGQVVLMNPAFQRLFGLSPQTPLHNAINFYVSEEELCKLVIDISKGKYIDFEDIPTHEFSTGSGQYLMARGQPVLGEKNECLGAVVTFMDITAMKVLDRLKSEFVAKVSHELRSPLSTIHEQLGVVLRDAMEEESQRDQYLLTRAQEKTQSLISMIGDLLDLSRIESKSAKMDLKPIQLEDLLKSVVDFLDVRVKAKNQTLTLKLSETKLSELTTDPMALESIFGNLITNAINYTQDGGRIQVTASQAMDKILVSVEDNGFGIDAKYLDQIFEKFYRVKNENTRFITGTGLGLPIVKGLVDSLGGTITVESTPGMGSTFTVMLPVNR